MINAVSTSDPAAAAAAAMKQATGLNKDDFLQLLVTQLKNQDPLNPQDRSAFVAQLAQLTQVEQTYNINSNLQNLLASQNNASNLSSISFIGKVVSAQNSQVALTSGSQSTVGMSLPSDVTQVSVQIKDASGKVVMTLTQGATAAGISSMTWDGKSDGGQVLPSGTYSFTVSGTDASGGKIDGTPMIQGQVTGVRLSGSSLVLTVNGLDVPLSSIVEVKGGSV
jgi:flagellar basal-body rod modification protein FlgD